MSLTCSLASAVSLSASNEPECEPSRSASATPTASECCGSTGQLSLFGETCEPSPFTTDGLWPTPTSDVSLRKNNYAQGGKALGTSILPAAASPARTFRLQAEAQALRASAAAYGRSSPELLAKYDPATSSWRTSQLCLDGALAEFSETWPRSGTMRSGTAYRLAPLVPLTDEIGSGSWPTVKSADAERGGRGDLLAWVRGYENKHHPPKWPTPAARDWRSGRGRLPNGHTAQLAEVIGGSLNPTWVEWLMGFPLGWTDCAD
jgi:hypothetical protein